MPGCRRWRSHRVARERHERTDRRSGGHESATLAPGPGRPRQPVPRAPPRSRTIEFPGGTNEPTEPPTPPGPWRRYDKTSRTNSPGGTNEPTEPPSPPRGRYDETSRTNSPRWHERTHRTAFATAAVEALRPNFTNELRRGTNEPTKPRSCSCSCSRSRSRPWGRGGGTSRTNCPAARTNPAPCPRRACRAAGTVAPAGAAGAWCGRRDGQGPAHARRPPGGMR